MILWALCGILKLNYAMQSFPRECWADWRGPRGQEGLLRQSRICRNRLGVGELAEELFQRTCIKEPPAISLNKRIYRAYHSKVSVLLLCPPPMASLRLIPYAYVPTKRRPRNNDQRSSVDKHPGAHHITQQSKLGVLPEKALQSSTAERPGDTRRASDSVHATTADELVGQRTQNLASISSAEVFSNGDTADQDTLGREGGYSQVQFTGRLNPTAGTKSRLKANQ